MSESKVRQKVWSGFVSFFMGVGSTFRIACLVIYLGILVFEGVKFADEVWNGEIQPSVAAYKESMRAEVAGQAAELEKVKPFTLLDVMYTTLEGTKCDWLFHCVEIQVQTVMWHGAAIPKAQDVQPILVPGDSFPIPTAHTIRGTPHALKAMVVSIGKAGFWAVLMFAACTVLWVALWVWMMRTDHVIHPYLPYLMIVCTPLAITVMVWCVQWVGQLMLTWIGWWPVTLAAYVAAWSGAIAVIVGLPHAWKTPHELHEAVEGLRKI
jgi:hypothetical protein